MFYMLRHILAGQLRKIPQGDFYILSELLLHSEEDQQLLFEDNEQILTEMWPDSSRSN
jgi:hypothetical protein